MENLNDKGKELLLKDLSARVPHETIVSIGYWENGNKIVWNKEKLTFFILHQIEENDAWEFIKPYLRPLSSMTSDEEYEYYQIKKKDSKKALTIMDYGDHLQQLLFPINSWAESISWLNAHHFDYRGLIEQGLAIEATEGMYDIK